jgi:hypothetical protein
MENTENLNRDPKGYYAMLGVSPDVTPDELRKAYDSTIDRYHKNGNDRATIETLEHIYWFILRHDDERRAYDCGYKPALKPTILIWRPNLGGLPPENPPPKSWWEKLTD